MNAVTCPACASTFTPTLWPALRRVAGGLRDDLHVTEDGRAAFERVPCLCGGAPLDLPLATGGGPLARCWRSGGLSSGWWLVEVDPDPTGRYLIARRVPGLGQSAHDRPRFYARASGRERRSPHTRSSESFLSPDDLQRVLAEVDQAVGIAAQQLARMAPQPDLILLDVMMPGDLDGLQVCARVRALPALQGTRVVLLTARGQTQDRDAGQEAGADEYLIKPFSPLQLIETIERLMPAT